MPRKPRQCPVGLPVHVIQRGINKQACFEDGSDRLAYAMWLREAANHHGADIHAWVFMTNHVHLLVTPRVEDAVSNCMQSLGRQYVRFFNNRHGRTGSLWEGRFKSCLVQEESYFLMCQRYIELNPVRAGMVGDPADYPWSSYRAHAFGQKAAMWRPHAVYLELGRTTDSRRAAYRQLFTDKMSRQVVDDIRNAVNTGLAFGTRDFKRRVEKLTGQRQHQLKRGPRARAKCLKGEEFLI